MADPAPAPAGSVPSASHPASRAADLVSPAVEMDTADDEEASSSWEALRSTLLPPDGMSLPTTAKGTFLPAFALLVNGRALNAWVKQPSPSCAAAVVAGAWNALVCADGRRDARAMSTRDVLDAMSVGAERALERKKKSFARLLGVTSESFDAFERAVLERIARDPSGATLGGRSKADPAMRRAAVMLLVEETATSGGGDDDASRDFFPDEARRARRQDAVSADGRENETDVDVDVDASLSRTSAFAAVAALLREEEEARAAANVNENAPPSVAATSLPKNARNVIVVDAAETKGVGAVSKPKNKKRFPRRLGPPSAAFGGRSLASAGDVGEGDDGVQNTSKEARAETEDAETDAVDAADDDDAAEDDEDSVDVAEDSAFATTKKKTTDGWAWRADLWDVFKRRGGLEKLRRDKPSTAAFGNAEVMRLFQRLIAESSESDDDARTKSSSFSARVAFGVKTKTRTKLSYAVSKHVNQNDDLKTEARELANSWASLRSLFAEKGTFLVSHHGNHYAPVYALRERREIVFDENTKSHKETETREMLTARRGQRPSVWIPWSEAISTMRRWNGYGIMAFERREA